MSKLRWMQVVPMIITGYFILGFVVTVVVWAHCDTMDGPVVTAAKIALQEKDVTPVLKWIRPEDEKEVRTVFSNVLAVRSKGPESRELADTYLFETIVRLHRASEGEPYTGLKAAGAEMSAAVISADRDLENGSVENLVKLVTNEVAEGIRSRFIRVLEAKKNVDKDVESGRAYVKAYVEYLHYVEEIYQMAAEGLTYHVETRVIQNNKQHID